MDGDGIRILVVDDVASIRRTLAETLTRAGYQVRQAADGVEAGRVWRSQGVDLVILDLYMPGKEGIETIRELQAFAPGIPIIAMSGGGNHSSGIDLLKVTKRLGAVLSPRLRIMESAIPLARSTDSPHRN